MAHHLHCNKIDLGFVRKDITDMCLVQADGTIPSVVTGKKAKQALMIYLVWKQSEIYSNNGKPFSVEELAEADRRYNFKKSQVEYACSSKGKLEVSKW